MLLWWMVVRVMVVMSPALRCIAAATATRAQDTGHPVTRPQVVCLFCCCVYALQHTSVASALVLTCVACVPCARHLLAPAYCVLCTPRQEPRSPYCTSIYCTPLLKEQASNPTLSHQLCSWHKRLNTEKATQKRGQAPHFNMASLPPGTFPRPHCFILSLLPAGLAAVLETPGAAAAAAEAAAMCSDEPTPLRPCMMLAQCRQGSEGSHQTGGWCCCRCSSSSPCRLLSRIGCCCWSSSCMPAAPSCCCCCLCGDSCCCRILLLLLLLPVTSSTS